MAYKLHTLLVLMNNAAQIRYAFGKLTFVYAYGFNGSGYNIYGSHDILRPLTCTVVY